MKVYLIYQMFRWSDEMKFDEPSVIYGVVNEKQARKDCIRLQTTHNQEATCYKIIYFYEETLIFL